MRSVKFRVLAALGILLADFAAVNLGFLLLYRYDNKYTAPVPQPKADGSICGDGLAGAGRCARSLTAGSIMEARCFPRGAEGRRPSL